MIFQYKTEKTNKIMIASSPLKIFFTDEKE
jgi:hypothetical protein